MLPTWSTNGTSAGRASSSSTWSSARSGGRCPRLAHRRGERGGQGGQEAHIARTAAQVPGPPQDALALDPLLLRVHGGQCPAGHHPSVYRSPEGGLGREDLPLPPVPLRHPTPPPGEHGRDVPPPLQRLPGRAEGSLGSREAQCPQGGAVAPGQGGQGPHREDVGSTT